MDKTTLKTAVVGIGGFAAAHHTALATLEASGLVQVVATCDPLHHELKEAAAGLRFSERGVQVFDDFDSLLEAHGKELDLVTVASPIRHHADHHRACLERGIACYLEKPPTLDPEELEAMIACETAGKLKSQVGFNYISQPWRLALKRRLLQGEFGALRRVGFLGLWQRPPSYFRRNNWAGRLRIGDYILLDSCCGNAMAHYVHNLLFHAGTNTLMAWEEADTVTAELYRSHEIEGTDTIFARGILKNGVDFVIAASHACHPKYTHQELLQCDRANITISQSGECTIQWTDGRKETTSVDAETNLAASLIRYRDYVIGRETRPVTTLEDCRPFVHLNALFYLAARQIITVPSPELSENGGPCIPGIEAACETLLRENRLPSEAGLPWAIGSASSQGNSAPELRSGLLKVFEGFHPPDGPTFAQV